MEEDKLEWLKSIGEVSFPRTKPGIDFTYKGKTIYFDTRPHWEGAKQFNLEEFKNWVEQIFK